MSEETETTNKVLETKLDGFKELTETKFKNIEQSLSRIETCIGSYSTKIELEEVKKDFNKSIQDIYKAFTQHNLDDKESFGSLKKQSEDLMGITKFGIGGLTVITFFLPFLLHYWLHI